MEDKNYGLVLAGGGTKGAFQVGVWKALMELNINITSIAGASIGALNGALFLQDNLEDVIKMYSNIKIDNIMNVTKIDSEKNIFDLSNIFNLTSDYTKNKGIDNSPLQKMIEKNIDIEKIYNSEIDFGLIAYSVKNRKPLIKFKNEILKEEMKKYLLASSCFPIFKPQLIDGEEYYDGGLYDNIPSNMLIEKEINNIIIVDVTGIGFNRKTQNKDVYIKVIGPSEDLGGTFEFNHDKIMRNIEMGYYDTMKSFNKLQGHIYYFTHEEFAKFLENFTLQTIYGLEYAAKIYKMKRLKVYTYEEFLKELKARHENREMQYKKYKNKVFIRKSIKEIFEKGFGICYVKDIYMDRPASKLSNKLLHFVQDYLVAAKALIELGNLK